MFIGACMGLEQKTVFGVYQFSVISMVEVVLLEKYEIRQMSKKIKLTNMK